MNHFQPEIQEPLRDPAGGVFDFRPAQARAAAGGFRPRGRPIQSAARSEREPDLEVDLEDRDREIDFRSANVQRKETGGGLADFVELAVLIVWLIFFR